MVSVGVKLPAAERARPCTRKQGPPQVDVLSGRIQTKTALPFGSTASWGKLECRCPGVRVCIALKLPAAERARVWVREQPEPPQSVVESGRFQTKTALPF
jgi:hypothetical protein